MFSRKSTPPAAAEATALVQPETLGSFLRQARISQGLELTTIAEATRITLKNLLAIEEDNRSALPADVFSRGFVKLYAAHLKLDPQEAISHYERQWEARPPFCNGPAARAIAAPTLTWSGLVIILLLLALVIGGRLFYPSPQDGNGPQRYAAASLTTAREAAPYPAGRPDPCAGAMTGVSLISHRP